MGRREKMLHNKKRTLRHWLWLSVGPWVRTSGRHQLPPRDWRLDENKAYPRRSSLILLQGVDHVYVSGITMKNPANHTLIFQKCNDAVVEGAKFQTFYCDNGDGIEFIHGKGLKVYNNVFNNGDDCVNFSASQGAEGAKDTTTENIWIFNNSFHNGHGAVVSGKSRLWECETEPYLYQWILSEWIGHRRCDEICSLWLRCA